VQKVYVLYFILQNIEGTFTENHFGSVNNDLFREYICVDLWVYFCLLNMKQLKIHFYVRDFGL